MESAIDILVYHVPTRIGSCNVKAHWSCRKGITRTSFVERDCSFCSFLNGNAGLVGNPVNEVGYGGEARWVSFGTASRCTIADDTQVNTVVSFTDCQCTATVTL